MTVETERPKTRRWGEATSRAVRLLALRSVPTLQVDLARELDVTQPRISQIGRLLATEGVRFADVHEADQRARLVLLYALHHAPAVVTETLWYDIDPSHEQVARAVDYLVDVGAAAVVSADAAPDFVAPWRSPTLTAIYTNLDAPLDSAGFVPAMARGEASIVLRHVSDPSLLEPWQAPREAPFPLAHPLQQIWDLRDLGGEDRFEASERLMRRVVMGTL
ncbi:MAG: hypothetical protein WAV54_10185 [Acidimicrobiales bacterium]